MHKTEKNVYWKIFFAMFIGFKRISLIKLFVPHFSLTHSLTHSRLVNLIDVTLACEDAYAKLVEVVTFAGVGDENRVGNSLMQIWTLTFGLKATLLFRL